MLSSRNVSQQTIVSASSLMVVCVRSPRLVLMPSTFVDSILRSEFLTLLTSILEMCRALCRVLWLQQIF